MSLTIGKLAKPHGLLLVNTNEYFLLKWLGIHIVLASKVIDFCFNLVILSENYRDMFQLFWSDKTHKVIKLIFERYMKLSSHSKYSII